MEINSGKKCVLNQIEIQRKIRRMALQVAEQNTDEKKIIIAGIEGNGEIVAKELILEIEKLLDFEIKYVQISMNKKNPGEIFIYPQLIFNDETIIVVDDVANTGKTMLYALKPFLQHFPKKIQTCVLVERSHKLFPVQADYVGISISTTLQEHIRVDSENGMLTGAWLF